MVLRGGLPTREPIAHYGPFPMSARDEIRQAVEDFDNGRTVPWLASEEQTAWRSFLAMHDELMVHLERGLQQRSGLSLGDFAVLVELSEAPGEALRPTELCRRLRWEQSRLSHRLRRMEQRGLLRRTGCDEDGRGALVELTASGRETIELAAPGHVRDLRALFVDVLGRDGMLSLGSLSERVIAGLRDSEDHR